MIVTTVAGAEHETRRRALEAAGAEILVTDGTVKAGLVALAARGLSSVLLEGGAVIHAAAWDEGVVDGVRLYVTPHRLGTGGVRFLDGRRFSIVDLQRSRVTPLGSDVMIEGYVHRPR
jgi:diaminohydroxyphosphoribosylaminopyrimidine deaminase/5-amino-6-(5-phosphoribosylamino)uracil reductase